MFKIIGIIKNTHTSNFSFIFSNRLDISFIPLNTSYKFQNFSEKQGFDFIVANETIVILNIFGKHSNVMSYICIQWLDELVRFY